MRFQKRHRGGRQRRKAGVGYFFSVPRDGVSEHLRRQRHADLACDGLAPKEMRTKIWSARISAVRYNLAAIFQNEIVQRHLRLLSSSLGLLSNSPIPLPYYQSRAERGRPDAALNSLYHEVPSRTLPLGLPMTRRGAIDCFAVIDFLACVQAPVALPEHEARFRAPCGDFRQEQCS